LRREKEKERARKVAAEKARKEAEEAERKQRDLKKRERREEEERQRVESERRLAEEKRRKEFEEKERRRKEEEERRRETLRFEREAKRKREAEERHKANEWKKRISVATEVLLWHRWKRALSRKIESSVGSRRSLGSIDPFYKTDCFHLVDVTRMAAFNNGSRIEGPISVQPTSKQIIEESIRRKRSEKTSKLGIADMALREVESMTKNAAAPFGSQKSTLLLKVALICPETMNVTDQSYASLLYHWIGSHIDIGKIERSTSNGNSNYSSKHEARVVIVRGSSYEVCSTADIALFVIPPQWSDPEQKGAMLGPFASSLLDEDIPRVALVLSDVTEGDQIQKMNNLIATELGGNMSAIPTIHPSELSMKAFESALEFAFCRIAKLFVHEACVSITRIPAMHLATKTILTVLWQCIPSVVGEDVDEDIIVECSRLSILTLVEELSKQTRRNKTEWSLWPAPEFSSKGCIIESYFTEKEGLPLEWMRYLDHDFLHETYEPLLEAFRGHFRDAYQRIVVDAPITVQDDCASECAQGQYRRCLEKALSWMQKVHAPSGCNLYLPEGMLELVMKDVAEKIKTNPLLMKRSNSKSEIPSLTGEDSMYNDSVFLKRIEPRETSKAAFGNRRNLSVAAAASNAFTKRCRSTSQKDQSLKKQRLEKPYNATDRKSAATTTTTMGMAADLCTANDLPTAATLDHCRTENVSETKRKTKAVVEGDLYAKKLERLLHGDETIDFILGDSSLSRILRDVPKPKV